MNDTYTLNPSLLPSEGKDEFRKLWQAAVQAGALVKKETFSLTYSTDFITFWDSLPSKRNKNQVWNAFKEALKGGYTASQIQKGVPTLIKQEKARQKAKGDEFNPINPVKWLREKRWEDEEDVDLSKPKPSTLQKQAEMVYDILDLTTPPTENDKRVLSVCLGDGLTMQNVLDMKYLWSFDSGKSVSHYLYEVTQIVNNQRKP